MEYSKRRIFSPFGVKLAVLSARNYLLDLELGGPLQFIDLFKVLNVVYLFVSDENTKIH